MKKLLVVGAFVLILFTIVNVGVTYAAGENLISNPSVESSAGRLPVGWSHVKKGNNISLFTHTAGGFDGAKSLSIKVTQYVAGESYWAFNAITVASGDTYVYSEYYKSTANSSIYAKVKRLDGTEVVVPISNPSVVSNWTNVTGEITIPANAVSMTIVHAAKGLGTLDTDKFSLVKKEVVIDPNPPIATSTPTSTPPIATSTPTSTPPVVSGNPIPNPSLEEVSSTPTLPLHWRSVKTGNNNARFSYLNTGHTGTRSLKVEITKFTSGLAYYRFDSAPVIENKTYDFSFYHKSDTYSEIDAEITLENGDIVYQYLGVTYPSADWTLFSTRIRMPENAKSVSIYTILYAKGSIVTDDYALTPVTIVPLNRSIISLTYDDFFNSMYDTLLPMFREKGFVGTIYLTTKDLGLPDTMSPEKLQEIHDYGFEIGGHTVNHPHLPFISSSEVDFELAQSKADILAFSGITAKNFATPYGEYNDAIKDQIKSYYRSHRSVDVGYNTKDNFDILNIKAMSATNQTTPETVLGWIDDAIADKAWLVMVYHDIVDNGGTWTNTPAHMQTVIDGIASRGVTIKTVEDALNEILPQI